MTSDELKLKELAEAATPGPWAIKEDACNGEDDAYCHWHDVGPFQLIGKNADADSKFIAAANPTAILSLLARIEALEQDAKHLHVKLAGETLRADQGWERYEAANRSRNALEAAMVSQQDKGKETV